jgi:hypothetical protein
MELSTPIRLGTIAGAVGLALAVTSLAMCGELRLPPKPPPPAETLATSQDTLRVATQTESTWVTYLERDALTAAVPPTTPTAMARRLVRRIDETPRSLAPGEPAIEAAGLRLLAVATDGVLSLVIENPSATDVAYRVLTRPRPDAGCARGDGQPYNAHVVAARAREIRDECTYRSGMALEISVVESIDLAPLQAFYLSKVPPRALGAEPRLAAAHEPELPRGTTVCNVAMPQILRAAIEDGTIQWRDLVDFYARHRCDSYRFPQRYRAFERDGERPLPDAE